MNELIPKPVLFSNHKASELFSMIINSIDYSEYRFEEAILCFGICSSLKRFVFSACVLKYIQDLVLTQDGHHAGSLRGVVDLS